LERIPALELEAAMLARLRLLAKNPKLIAQIAHDSKQEGVQGTPNLEKLIELKKSEITDIKAKISNLAERIAALPKEFPAEGLFENLQMLEATKEAARTGLKDLESELKAGRQIVDMEYVFKALQLFNKGEFSELTPTEQKDLIDGFVYRITLTENKIHAEYYGQADMDIFDFDGVCRKSEKGQKNNLEGPRSGVLPSFNLVDANGIEPMTPTMPLWCSTN
jgi:hypothetical protein